MPLDSGRRRLTGGCSSGAVLSQSPASCINPRLAYSSSPSFSSSSTTGQPGLALANYSSAIAGAFGSAAGSSYSPAGAALSLASSGGLSTLGSGFSTATGGLSSLSSGGAFSSSATGYTPPAGRSSSSSSSSGGYIPTSGGHTSSSSAGGLLSSGHLSRPRSKLNYSGSLGRSTVRPRSASVHSASPTTAGLNLSPSLLPRSRATAAATVRAGRSPSVSSSLSSLSGRSYSSGYGSTNTLSNANAGGECGSRTTSRANSVENGEVDYKKLYEAAMIENDKLQQRLVEAQADCRDAKLNLDKTLQMSSSRAAAAESDRREKRAIEHRLSEMERELKQLQKLKAENEKLKAENRALTRVVSRLSNTAAAGSATSQ